MRPLRHALLCALTAGCAAPQRSAAPATPSAASAAATASPRGASSEGRVTVSSTDISAGEPDDDLRPPMPVPFAPAGPGSAPATLAAPAAPVAVESQSSAPTPPGAAVTGAPRFAPPPAREQARDDSIAGLAAAIVQERSRIAVALAGLVACREVCEASGGICRAAAQICHLTGDEGLTAETARDGRCARALQACTEAGQMRDGRCPRCPAPG